MEQYNVNLNLQGKHSRGTATVCENNQVHSLELSVACS